MSGPAVAWVFEHSPLRGAERLVHVAIADTVNDAYGYEFWMSLSTLAEKTKVHRNTVREAVRKLEEHGMLVLVSADRGRSCKYQFVMPDPAPVAHPAPETRPAADCANPAPESANPAPQARGPRATGAPIPIEPNEPNGTQTLGFAEFWTLYPRKVKKPKALTAWNTATKHTAAGVIISGLERWVEHWQADSTEERFIPHPTTWLNGHQWNDPTPALAIKASRAAAADDAAARLLSMFDNPLLALEEAG